MIDHIIQNAGLYAMLAAVATILSFAALFIFFAGVGVFGPINDALSVFQMLFLIPVAVVLHLIFRQQIPALSLIVTSIAVLAMLMIAILQVLLVLRQVQFEQTIKPILLLGIPIGLWWIITGYLSLRHPSFPAGLAWASILSGLCFLLIAYAFWVQGPEHPLSIIGFILSTISIPLWGFWLGRLFISGPITIPA